MAAAYHLETVVGEQASCVYGGVDLGLALTCEGYVDAAPPHAGHAARVDGALDYACVHHHAVAHVKGAELSGAADDGTVVDDCHQNAAGAALACLHAGR